MQPPHGYAPTYPNQPNPQQYHQYPQQPGGQVSTAGIASIAKPTLAFLGLRAAFVAISWIAWRVIIAVFAEPGGDFETIQLMSSILRGIEGLVGFVGIVFFLVWFSRVYTWIRQTRGGTRYSNGMAVGGWFIPFANFVVPYLAMRDAWRRAMNDENGGLVLGWWLTYMGTIFFAIFYAVDEATRGLIRGEAAAAIYPILSYTGMALEIAAWGIWFFLVQRLTKRATTGA